MDDLLQRSLALCRDPAITVRGGTVVGLNRAAEAAFPQLRPGVVAGMLLPKNVLESPPEAAGFAELAGRTYTLRCAADGELRVYLCTPAEPEGTVRGVLSDGAMNQLLSSLCNLQLAAELLFRKGRAPSEGDAVEQAILLRSCYQLRRQLGNLRLAVLLLEERQPFLPRETELAGLCTELCDAVRSATADLGVTLRFVPMQPELSAEVDEELLERLLLNLLSNSFHHTPRGGTVTLTLEGGDGRVCLTVKDDGEGIPAEVLDTVFRRYAVRAVPGRTAPALTGGLGLSVASGIARLHGGSMVLESRPGQGTVARVSFPAHRGDVRLSSEPPERRSPVEAVRLEFAELMELESFTERFRD